MRFLFFVFIGVCLVRITTWEKANVRKESFCSEIESSKRRNPKFQIRKTVSGRVIESFRGLSEFRFEKLNLKQTSIHVSGKFKPMAPRDTHKMGHTFIEAYGIVDCSEALKNFAALEDSPFKKNSRNLKLRVPGFSLNVSPSVTGGLSIVGNFFRSQINSQLAAFPNLHGIVWAVWTGETEGLELRLVELYREVGLLPLIALSGQHVAVFVVVFTAISQVVFNPFFGNFRMRLFYKYWNLLLPFFCSFVLAVTGEFNPSILRTLAMAFALLILRMRKCLPSTVQILSVSSGMLILWDPALVNGVGFILSVAGTFWILVVSDLINSKAKVKEYVFHSIIMPIVSLPIIVFYFGHWSFLNPVFQILMSWLWTLVIIPAGLLIPIVLSLPRLIKTPVLVALDQGVKKITELQISLEEIAHHSYRALPRLTWGEAFLVTFLFFVIFKRFQKRKNKMAQSAFFSVNTFDFSRQKVSN